MPRYLPLFVRADRQKIFRNGLTGRSPNRYPPDQRLNKAAALLSGTEISIGETAAESGFRDSNYFTRQFRARFGVSPRTYRRKCRLSVSDAP